MDSNLGQVKIGLLAIGIIVLVVLLVGLLFWFSYNGMVSADQTVQEKWAQVESQYQRRIDLIPNVVNTVKGTANFEQETLSELTRLRSQWQTAPSQSARIDTGNQIESTISKLLLITENYPQLTATQAYRDLIVELEGTENRVQFARGEFNVAVREYNTKIKSFPGNMVAGMFGFSEKKYFQSKAGADQAPTVDFG